MNLRRKRMILMRDVWYGYNRTASGNPVTLDAAKRLRQLTIYGNAVQSNLPEGYTQVEYLQSTGTQWIVTDITSDQDTGIYLEAAFDELLPAGSHDASGYRLIGCVNNNFGIGEYPGTGEFNFMRKNGIGATVNSDIGVTADTAKHTFKNNYLNDGLFVVDDTEKTAPEATFTNNYGMAIFRTTYNSATKYYNDPCKAKIYRIKISQGAEVVHDIFPCTRDSDSKPGMYDTLTDTFMTNAGTGEFTAGAEVTEPSPDNPIDVQLCGDRTGNLYDVNDHKNTWPGDTVVNTGWITTNFDNSFRDSNYWVSYFSKYRDVIEPNTQYTLVTEIEYISDCSIYVSSVDSGNDISPFSTNVHYSTAGTYCRTVTSKSSLSDCNVLLRTIGYVEAGDTLTAKFRISLLKGSYTAETIPAYEPYGYKVSGRVEGVNLFDKSNVTLGYRLYQDGQLYPQDEGNEQFVSDYISVEDNTQYYYNATTNWDTRLCEYDINKSLLVQHDQSYNVFTDIFTTSENTAYVRFTRPQSQMDMTMISKGSEAQPYEPYQPPQDFAVYLPQQIAKVGDVADTVVLDMEQRTATLVQNIRRYDFTGDETWIVEFNPNYPGGQRYWSLIGLGLKNKRYLTPSNRFRTTDTMQNYINSLFAYGNSFYLYMPDYQNTADIQEFFSTNPTYAYVQYATPVTTDITAMQNWDAMPQVKGTVTLTLSAEVPPSGAEAVYYSAERGD